MNRIFSKGKFLSQLLLLAAALTACNDDELSSSAGAPLQVSVTAGSPMVSRAIVTDEYLPDGSTIGVTVTDADGNSYDSQNYSNVKYTAAGTGDAQTWTGASDVSLSTTVGKAVAYYPWQEVADLTAVPVETETQTDYMYSKPVTGLSLASPAASFTMQHALTDIRIKVIRGDYTGEGALESVSVKSSAFATGATLNVHDGSLASISGAGTEFKSEYTDKTITPEGLVQDYLVVPVASVTSGDVSVFIVVDGKKFTAPVQFTEAFLQGAAYSFGLVLDNTGLNVASVTAEKWGVVSQVVAQPELQPNPDEYIIRVSIPKGEDNNGGAEPGSLFSLNHFPNDALKTAYKKFMEGRTAPVLNSRAAADTRPFVHNVVGFVGTIDWGDGTTTTYDVATDWPSHVYAEAGEYLITTKGVMTGLSVYINSETPVPYSPEWITDLIYIGKDCGITSMAYAFAFCTNIKTITAGLFDNCTEVTDFQGTFAFCGNLQSISEGLFDNCTKVEDFYGAFTYCTGLQVIPEELFDKCTEVKNFGMTFGWCYSLTTIPEGLFENCTKVTNFEDTFSGCSSLTSIPQGLFDKCTKVTSFAGTFAGGYDLMDTTKEIAMQITEIPEGLFDHCTEVTSFRETFAECRSLESIPEGLFDKCTKVTQFNFTFRDCVNLKIIPSYTFGTEFDNVNFSGTFSGCENIIAIKSKAFNCPNIIELYNLFYGCESLTTIENEAFNCPNVTSFSNTFSGCSSLTSIPQGLFDKCTKVTSFDATFAGCANLQSIPNGLFDKCTEVESFYRTFVGCESLESIPAGLFDYCTKVKDFYYCFSGTGITSIPEGLFKNCTEVTDFEGTFYGCESLTEITAGLFDNCTKVTSFLRTFAGCDALQTIPEGFFENCTEVTNFQGTFAGCGLTSISEGLFDKCTKVTSFERTFDGCTAWTGESPYTLVDGVKVHLYERANYPENFTAPTNYTNCFINCTGLTDYANIPEDWI